MNPIRITAAGERIVKPIIALAHCSKLARIIVTGANSAEAVTDLHRLGYARATTTLNCGLPAGQYDVVLIDGRQRSIKSVETTLDWAADFLSPTGVLIVWLDAHQSATTRPLRSVLENHGFWIEAGTVHERDSAIAARRYDKGVIAIIALDDPRRAAILKRHLTRIDDPVLKRAFRAAVNIDEQTASAEHKARDLWFGLRR